MLLCLISKIFVVISFLSRRKSSAICKSFAGCIETAARIEYMEDRSYHEHLTPTGRHGLPILNQRNDLKLAGEDNTCAAFAQLQPAIGSDADQWAAEVNDRDPFVIFLHKKPVRLPPTQLVRIGCGLGSRAEYQSYIRPGQPSLFKVLTASTQILGWWSRLTLDCGLMCALL